MNNLHNIVASPHKTGGTHSQSGASATKDTQGLPSFVDQIIQALQDTSPADKSSKKTETAAALTKNMTAKIAEMLKKSEPGSASTPNKTPDDLAAKIASTLQKNGLLPESMQGLSPEELTAKIAAMLQKIAATPDTLAIKPTLTSDLASQMSTQIQAQATPEKEFAAKLAEMLEKDGDTSTADLAAMLDKIQPGSGDNGDIAKIIAQLQQPQDAAGAPTLDPAIFQQLKDKIAQLLENGGKISPDDIVKLKTDMIQSLKDQGMDQPTIQNYLASLAHTLKDAADLPTDQAKAAAPFIPLAALDQSQLAAAAAKEHLASQQKTEIAAPKQLIPADGAHDNRPIEFTRPQAVTAPASDQKNNAAAQPQAASAAQAAAPQPQNLTAKIAGLSVNPGMISALANSDGSFGTGDFGTGANNGQLQDMMSGVASLKALTPDAANSQSFTNYLSAARGTPSSVTQMVNLQMQRNIAAKIDTMTIQLDPVDLGKLDIKLKFDKEGGVKAHLSADKPETLAMLQRDSQHLQKVLQQSGLDIDEKSLSFDLRQQGRQHNLEGFNNGQNKGNDNEFSAHVNGISPDNMLQAQIAVLSPGYITRSGVNIMV